MHAYSISLCFLLGDVYILESNLLKKLVRWFVRNHRYGGIPACGVIVVLEYFNPTSNKRHTNPM